MQDYDVALELLLRGPAKLTMRELAGVAIETWLDVELPKVQNLPLDLLGETADRNLIHMELQSSNDTAMPLRMAECSASFLISYYTVGEAPLRMDRELRGDDVVPVSRRGYS